MLPPEIFGGGKRLGDPDRSTLLADGEESELVPWPVFWAMKYHQRHQADGEGGGFEQQLGDGDDVVSVVDDGSNHCLLRSYGRLERRTPLRSGRVQCPAVVCRSCPAPFSATVSGGWRIRAS